MLSHNLMVDEGAVSYGVGAKQIVRSQPNSRHARHGLLIIPNAE